MNGAATPETPSADDLFGMSDDDFAQLNMPDDPAASAGTETSEASETVSTEEDPSKVEEASQGGSTNEENPGSEEDSKTQISEGEEAAEDSQLANTEGAGDGTEAGTVTAEETSESDGAKPGEGAATTDTAPDFATIGQEILKPFKANGRTIEPKNAEEARRLMQMGANYTRKMQELQPHRKMLMMLQANNLDESKLDFLIALDQKDPEAIKKLIKDSGIDPLEIDTSEEPAFREGAYRVTDSDVAFRTTLDELSSTDEGKQTIIEVNTKFDETSKEALWKSPEIMAVIHEQRVSGVYDIITAEMDRQITLGLIPPTTPFLQAYKIVGDQLVAAQTSGHPQPNPTGQAGQPAPVVVATRAAAPKPAVKNSDAASAASPTRSSPSNKQPLVNPLAMSDDEFMKQMAGRL